MDKDVDELDSCGDKLLTGAIMATSAVGAVLLATLLMGLLWWPRCAVCRERHPDLRTADVRVDGNRRHVCFGCAERMLAKELAELEGR